MPTLHPWYLVLIAPFAALLRSIPWIYLQGAMAWSFAVVSVEYNTAVFQEIHALKPLIYLPFLGLLFFGIRREQGLLKRTYPKVTTISVVIPTLNEATHIDQCLQHLQERPQIREIIVSDGGSTDQTLELVQKRGVRLMRGRTGRGIQIARGVEVATGDVILVLHGDGQLNSGSENAILRALNLRPRCVGGATAMTFDEPGGYRTLVRFLNNFRTRWTGIAFGDQGQFFRREALADINGFPDMLLMEDIELSLRLKSVGRVLFLKRGVMASGRRWKRSPQKANIAMVLYLFTRYLVQRRWHGGRVSEAAMPYFYQRYYGRTADLSLPTPETPDVPQ